MFSVLRAALNTRRPAIGPRSVVNLVNPFNARERTDGVVEAIYGEQAYVEWPNGAKSFESVRRLVRIDV
jgi:hypothetical protein